MDLIPACHLLFLPQVTSRNHDYFTAHVGKAVYCTTFSLTRICFCIDFFFLVETVTTLKMSSVIIKDCTFFGVDTFACKCLPVLYFSFLTQLGIPIGIWMAVPCSCSYGSC